MFSWRAAPLSGPCSPTGRVRESTGHRPRHLPDGGGRVAHPHRLVGGVLARGRDDPRASGLGVNGVNGEAGTSNESSSVTDTIADTGGGPGVRRAVCTRGHVTPGQYCEYVDSGPVSSARCPARRRPSPSLPRPGRSTRQPTAGAAVTGEVSGQNASDSGRTTASPAPGRPLGRHSTLRSRGDPRCYVRSVRRRT